MKTFDEYWESRGRNGLLAFEHEATWNAAREGMIPADQAVKVPPVEEWPSRAIGIAWFYTYLPVHDLKGVDATGAFFFPRPTPTWMPKVGEPVFFKIQPRGTLITALVDRVVGNTVEIKHDGIRLGGLISDVKPLDVSKIGLPWEKI